MRIPSPLLVSLTSLLLTTAGCAPGPGPGEMGLEERLAPPPVARACTTGFDATGTFCQYNSGFTERQRLVISDTAAWTSAWQQLWSRHSPQPELPTVDFEREVVLLASMGQRNSGGYVIELRNVTELANGLEVTVAEMSPDITTCLVTAALSEPLVALRIPRPQGEVRFTEVRERYRCQ
jgi:PrcB C-terminal